MAADESSAPQTAAFGTGRPEPVERPLTFDLSAPDLYLNRELTWLSFNRRVLAEAEEEHNPLLERIKFLAISASNLDEFFMKRIGGLKQQAAGGVRELTPDGHTPQWQITACYEVVRAQEADQRRIFGLLMNQLQALGIEIRRYVDLAAPERAALRDYYCRNVFPLITPLAIDPSHPFPVVSNLSLNLLVSIRTSGAKAGVRVNDLEGGAPDTGLFRIKVPVGGSLRRFVRTGSGYQFVPLEEIVAHNLDLLLPGAEFIAVEQFRVTRNANTEGDEEEADDLLALIETELRDRRIAPIVRLEIEPNFDEVRRGMLAAELGLDERADVFENPGTMALRDLMEIAELDIPELHYPPQHPIDHPRIPQKRSIFHTIRDAGSILLLHPYESFSTTVERFLREASEDPKVRALKMTLYRTSRDFSLLEYLLEAARNGKQVAVVVELKARFDEAANIQFASRLEEFGIHVNYGVVGLKTHCKVIQVVRQDYDGLRRYVHIGTGNYHPGTARQYADLGMLTCDSEIVSDVTELFNYLTTGYKPDRNYRKLLVAPPTLKRGLIARIEREMEFQRTSHNGLIRFKMNALEDPDVSRALYRASQAGVKIDLIVRDTCRLRPGIPGISENIRVVSIVGRFLEHGRIYHFGNGGRDEVLIGSADAMTRNLESRIEILAPVEDLQLRKEVLTIMDCQLRPNRCRWTMHSDGSYTRDVAPEDCQRVLIELANSVRAVRHRRRRGYARRNQRQLS